MSLASLRWRPNQRPVLSLTLIATDVCAERGGRPVLAGVGFTLRSGEALVVTGPNGAGKSTLLRVLAGLLMPTRGSIRLDPPDHDDADTPIAERAHYVGHADALKGALTPLENLAFAAAVMAGGSRTGEAAALPAEALARVSLSHAADLPCAYLSAGQRRRVALARLLVAFRPLWLLDEPATALDARSQTLLAEIMGQHLSAGGLIIAATHAPLGLSGLRVLRLGQEDAAPADPARDGAARA